METILLRRRTPREFHKDGENYEIGQSKHPGRREYDLAIKLPEEPKLLNKTITDDPSDIEAYWHKRFQNRRKGGEWFDLIADDIKAFKQRKFM